MLSNKYIAVISLAAALLSGCKEDEIIVDDNFDRPINVAAPILKSESSAKALAEEWLSGTEWYTDEDGVLTTTYTSIDSASASDVLKLNDVQCTISSPLSSTLGTTQSYLFYSEPLNSEPNQRFDYIRIKDGYINLTSPASTASGHAVLSLMDKNGVVKDTKGQDFSASWEIEKGTSQKVDLSDFVISPIEKDGNWYVKTLVTLTNLSDADGATLQFSYKSSGVTVGEARGYFGNIVVLTDNSTTRIAAFDRSNFPDEVDFKGVYTDFTVSSTIGVPLEWKMGTITFTSRNDKDLDLNYDFGAPAFPQQSYADYLKENVLTPQTKEIHIDEENSNIQDVINLHPVRYSYGVNVVANPEGEVEGETNFVTEDSKFVSEMKTTIPLWMRVSNMDREDHVDVDFDEIFNDDNIDYVDTVKIILKSINGMPLKATGQGYFCVGKTRVAPLFSENKVLCKAPELDSNDKVKEPVTQETVATLTHDQAKLYYEAGVDELYFESVITTTDDYGDKFVKFYGDYGLTLKISVEVVSSAKDK